MYEFASTNIGRFVTRTRPRPPPGDAAGEALEIPADVVQEVKPLKELTWTYVIGNPSMAAHQWGQRLAIRTLFAALNESAVGRKGVLFPTFYRECA